MKRIQLVSATLLTISTLALSSCQTVTQSVSSVGESAKDVGKSVKSGGKKVWNKVDQAPVAIGKTVGSGTKSASQKFALATNLPAKWYSKKISGTELRNKMNNTKFGGWYYMGSRKDHHYFALETTERTIYRVLKAEHSVDNSFPLANLKHHWRRMEKGSQPVFLD